MAEGSETREEGRPIDVRVHALCVFKLELELEFGDAIEVPPGRRVDVGDGKGVEADGEDVV